MQRRRSLSLREIPALSVMEGREKKIPIGLQTLSFKAWAPECLTQLSKIPVLKHLRKGRQSLLISLCRHLPCAFIPAWPPPPPGGLGTLPRGWTMLCLVARTLISPDRGSLAFSGPTSTMLLSLIRLCSCKDLSAVTQLLFKLWSLWCLQMVYTPKSIAEMSTQTQTHAHMWMWMHTHTSACTWECSCTHTSTVTDSWMGAVSDDKWMDQNLTQKMKINFVWLRCPVCIHKRLGMGTVPCNPSCRDEGTCR